VVNALHHTAFGLLSTATKKGKTRAGGGAVVSPNGGRGRGSERDHKRGGERERERQTEASRETALGTSRAAPGQCTHADIAARHSPNHCELGIRQNCLVGARYGVRGALRGALASDPLVAPAEVLDADEDVDGATLIPFTQKPARLPAAQRKPRPF
jgi:hypothetical protein